MVLITSDVINPFHQQREIKTELQEAATGAAPLNKHTLFAAEVKSQGFVPNVFVSGFFCLFSI